MRTKLERVDEQLTRHASEKDAEFYRELSKRVFGKATSGFLDNHDPETLAERTKEGHTDMLVTMGVCTHLGCVPLGDSGDFGGWFCPCHGSHYDLSGRIRKGPAPQNLHIPPTSWVDGTTILLG